MIDVTIVGSDGECGYAACPSAMTLFEQARMVQGLAQLRFPDRVAVACVRLEDGAFPELAARVRSGELELPLVLLSRRLVFDGGVPWHDLEGEIRAAIGHG